MRRRWAPGVARELAGWVLAAIVALVLWLAGREILPAWRFGLWSLVLLRLAMPTVVAWEQSEGPPLCARNKKLAHVTAETLPGRMLCPGPLRDSNCAPPVDRRRQRLSLSHYATSRRPSPTATWRRLSGVARDGTSWPAGCSASALLAARAAWLNLRLARAVGRMPVISDGPRTGASAGLLRRITHWCAARSATDSRGRGAALVGCRWPTILFPAGVLEGLGDEELRLIPMHELVHVKRRDVLVNWLATLVAPIHRPNPAVWGVLWRMRVEREMACDEMVMRGQGGGVRANDVRLAETLSLSLTPARARATAPAGAVESWKVRPNYNGDCS